MVQLHYIEIFTSVYIRAEEWKENIATLLGKENSLEADEGYKQTMKKVNKKEDSGPTRCSIEQTSYHRHQNLTDIRVRWGE